MSKPYPHLYNSRRWRRRSAAQLSNHPLCAQCERDGKTEIAILSHHIVEHSGDEKLFYFGEIESLCRDCHLKVHDRAQTKPAIGVDGWPQEKLEIRT